MIIGIPKEIKTDEKRVSITPDKKNLFTSETSNLEFENFSLVI